MFDLLANALHSSTSVVKLWFLLAVSVLLQVSALATTYHNVRKEATEVSKVMVKFYADDTNKVHVTNNGGGVLCGKPMRYMQPLGAGDAATRVMCAVCMKKAGGAT